MSDNAPENDTPEDRPKGGRPSKYKPEFVEQARKLCELGATDREVAEFFEVSEVTLNSWKHAHPEFLKSLKLGKEASDCRVEQSLYRRATGYSFDSEKVFQSGGTIIRAPIVEHVPPDTTACIFWLKNRQPALWRDKVEHSVPQLDDLKQSDPMEIARRVLFIMQLGAKQAERPDNTQH